MPFICTELRNSVDHENSLVLVTGGAGFIGSHLVRGLLAAGRRVRVLDDLSTGRRENLAGLEERVEFRTGSVIDAAVVAAATAGVGEVCHLAAVVSVPRSLKDPIGTNRVNVGGTLNVLEAAARAGVRRVVFTSSSSVYGNNDRQPLVETETPAPISPYGVQKLAGEFLAAAWTGSGRLDTLCLRLFNVYGPRQDPRSEYSAAIPRFLAAALRGESPVIYGDGLQSRDFTFVEDVVAGFLAALRIPRGEGKAVNLSTGRSTSVLDIARNCLRIAGSDAAPRFEPPRAGDVVRSCGDPARARDLLGAVPSRPIEEGLRITLEWLRTSGT